MNAPAARDTFRPTRQAGEGDDWRAAAAAAVIGVVAVVEGVVAASSVVCDTALVFLDQEVRPNLGCCRKTALLTQQSSPNEARETRRKKAKTDPHQDDVDRLLTAIGGDTVGADSTSVAMVSPAGNACWIA